MHSRRLLRTFSLVGGLARAENEGTGEIAHATTSRATPATLLRSAESDREFDETLHKKLSKKFRQKVFCVTLEPACKVH